jgi:hypothetical protein
MIMRRAPAVSVTLSDDLLVHLRRRADEEQVPMEWLVAGLVCDTMDSWNERTVRKLGVQVREVGGLRLTPTCN